MYNYLLLITLLGGLAGQMLAADEGAAGAGAGAGADTTGAESTWPQSFQSLAPNTVFHYLNTGIRAEQRISAEGFSGRYKATKSGILSILREPLAYLFDFHPHDDAWLLGGNRLSIWGHVLGVNSFDGYTHDNTLFKTPFLKEKTKNIIKKNEDYLFSHDVFGEGTKARFYAIALCVMGEPVYESEELNTPFRVENTLANCVLLFKCKYNTSFPRFFAVNLATEAIIPTNAEGFGTGLAEVAWVASVLHDFATLEDSTTAPRDGS